jgi:excisionase family DNA binding protein
MDVNPFYSISETAKILKISEEMVRILLRSGKIKGIQMNGIWRIHKSSLPQKPARELFEK